MIWEMALASPHWTAIQHSRVSNQSHLATTETLEADGYDSDKEVNNNNPIINEESLEEEEEELPEVGENLDAAEGEETATNVGTFVDIPQEAMKKEGSGARG